MGPTDKVIVTFKVAGQLFQQLTGISSGVEIEDFSVRAKVPAKLVHLQPDRERRFQPLRVDVVTKRWPCGYVDVEFVEI